MVLKQYRKDQRKKRKKNSIIYLTGIILIIVIPLILTQFMQGIYFKSPIILSKIASIRKFNEPEFNSFITIYLIDENEFCCSIHEAKKIKFILLKKAEVEKIIKRFPNHIYFIKACKTAKYNDLAYVVDILSINKIKTYAITDIEESDIIALNNLKKLIK